MSTERAKKTEYRSVSFPRALVNDVRKLIDGSGFWPGVGSLAGRAVRKLQVGKG